MEAAKMLQTNLKEVATSFYYCNNPEEKAIELSKTKEYRSLKEADGLFLDKHINEALLRYNLTRLNYCVCPDVHSSMKKIKNAVDNKHN